MTDRETGRVRTVAAAGRGRLLIVLALTTVVLVAEVVGGLLTGSLALLADAGHMFTDAVGLGLALGAIMLAAKAPSTHRTYGAYRLEILAAVVNAVLLFGVALLILVEAWRRFASPPDVASAEMLLFAGVGLIANLIGLLLLRGSSSRSLNIRGAYLEVLGDLLGSAAVIMAAAIIGVTGLNAVDPVASVIVALLILPRTWTLLREAVDVLLEATPKGMDLTQVRRHIRETEDVLDAHDLHVWTITSGMPVLSCHVVITEAALADGGGGRVLDRLSDCLSNHFDVVHCTFQLESASHVSHEHGAH